MRESTPRGPAIDLSEFERRLRGGQPAAKPKGDPLTELARLMQGDGESAAKAKSADLYDRLLTQEPPQARKSAPESSRPQAPRAASAPAGRPDAFGAALRGSLAPEAPAAASPSRAYPEPSYDDHAHRQAGHQDPLQARAGYGRTPQAGAAGRTEQAYQADPAAQYADPGAYHDDPRYADPNAHQADPRYADPHYAEGGWADESQNYLDYGPEGYEADDEQEPAPKGGLLRRLPKFRPWHAVAGISALAAVSIGWGFAHRNGGVGSHDIPTIGAPEGPVKIAPVAEEPQDSASHGAAVLERKEPAPVTQVVTHEEQAVDPQATPRAVEIGAGPVNAPHEPPPPAPRKVKTISVRPDGSVIENDAVPPAVTSGVGLDAESAEAAQGGTPKSVARPTSTASAAKAAAPKAVAPTAAAPKAAASKAAAPAKPKPPKVAAVEESPAADNPDDAAPAEEAPRGAGKGGYAVQFGAANSEAEARALLTQIAKKYAAQLGGRRPTFKPAKVDGKTVYRVRVGGVSKEAAAGICDKVKGGGGACFVAGN